MSLTEKQTIYSLQPGDYCLPSKLNGSDESLDCFMEDDQRSNEGVKLRNGLRNGLRSQNNRIDLPNSSQGIQELSINSSFFDQLIEEAKTRPVSDFELAFESSSFFNSEEKEVEQCLTNGLDTTLTISVQNHIEIATEQEANKLNTTEEGKKKPNRRKNQIKLIEDFEDQTEFDFNVQNKMQGKSCSRDSQGKGNQSKSNSSLKELRNFKNQPNDLNTNLVKSKREGKPSRQQIKPIQRIFIDKNVFKYNEGLVSAEEVRKSMPKVVLKKKRKQIQQQIFDRMNSNRLSIDLNQDTNSKDTNQQLDRDDKMPRANSIENHSGHLNLHEMIQNCLLFSSTNQSPVFDLYTFQDKISANLEQDDCQTSVVALIQLEQISIWTKEVASQIEWTKHHYKLDEKQQVFRCCRIDKESCVCVLFLVCSHSLVSLKYCLIDKTTKYCQLVHGETFEVTNIDLDLIHLCFVSPNNIALSIPRIDDDIIDVLIYDQFDFQPQFNKSKRIIYMLNNKDNKFSSLTNCFLASDELDHTFLAIFNQKLFMCNVNEYNKLPKMISLHKYADSDYSYFDVLYDKGIFYIFAGNYVSNTVRIIALNIDRCLADKLMKYDVERCLEEDRLNSDEMALDTQSDEFEDDEKTVRLFKRKGDHLLVIKNDNTVALFNMFSDEIIYQTNLSNVDQAAIAVLNQKTTILAVLNGCIVNLVDL